MRVKREEREEKERREREKKEREREKRERERKRKREKKEREGESDRGDWKVSGQRQAHEMAVMSSYVRSTALLVSSKYSSEMLCRVSGTQEGC